MVHLGDRSSIADTEASVDDLHRQFAALGGSSIADTVVILEMLNEFLRSHHIARHAMAEKHEVLAAGLGPEVGVEGQEPIHPVDRRPEVIRHYLGGLDRNPAETFVDPLQSAEDEFLSLLPVLRLELRNDFANDIEVDVASVRRVVCLFQVPFSDGFRGFEGQAIPQDQTPFGSIEAA
jgi:hypothetical protein